MPRTFAMTVRQWAADTKGELNVVREQAGLLLAESLTRGNDFGPGTPVDTGRLLSGWTVEGENGARSLGGRGPQGDPRRQPYVQRGRISRWIDIVARMAKRGNIRIYTEVPYAQYVDASRFVSKRKFISTVRQNWPAIVRQAVLRARSGVR